MNPPRCPTCDSPHPAYDPSTQGEGSPCADPFHQSGEIISPEASANAKTITPAARAYDVLFRQLIIGPDMSALRLCEALLPLITNAITQAVLDDRKDTAAFCDQAAAKAHLDGEQHLFIAYAFAGAAVRNRR